MELSSQLLSPLQIGYATPLEAEAAFDSAIASIYRN
jgi:hypothetical protein